MALVVLWLHLLAVVVWLGGLLFQSHVLFPQIKAGGGGPVAVGAIRRFRPVAWSAVGLLVLTGVHNLTRLPPLGALLETGTGTLLALKLLLALAAISLAAHRDFGLASRLIRALEAGPAPLTLLRTIAWFDRVVLLLGIVVLYLGLAVGRGSL